MYYYTVPYSVLSYHTQLHYSTVQYRTVLHCATVLHCTVLYSNTAAHASLFPPAKGLTPCVTCVSRSNLCHPRDFTSPTSRRGTLYGVSYVPWYQIFLVPGICYVTTYRAVRNHETLLPPFPVRPPASRRLDRVECQSNQLIRLSIVYHGI